jgi:hypothetical protein
MRLEGQATDQAADLEDQLTQRLLARGGLWSRPADD